MDYIGNAQPGWILGWIMGRGKPVPFFWAPSYTYIYDSLIKREDRDEWKTSSKPDKNAANSIFGTHATSQDGAELG
jgi:hypothetical protein